MLPGENDARTPPGVGEGLALCVGVGFTVGLDVDVDVDVDVEVVVAVTIGDALVTATVGGGVFAATGFGVS
jgi:hypothetical protein